MPEREPEPDEPAITPGRSLVRVAEDRGASLAETLLDMVQQLALRTPLHAMRLRGRYPLKLLGVPRDPVAGDARAGAALLGGTMAFGPLAAPLADLAFGDGSLGPGFRDHVQGFGWLRDLAAAAPRETAAPLAEVLMRRWLAEHGETVADPAWRADLWGKRIVAWTCHAPLILSSGDLVYRSAVLNMLARGARHLDRVADKAPPGLPRLWAHAGAVVAGLLLPGGDARLARAEPALAKALASGVSGDGGIVGRAPVDLVELVELLSCVAAAYDDRRREAPAALAAALARAVPALLGVTLGDGGLSGWQGGGALGPERVARAVAASGIRTRPQRQSRDWGYQRLTGGQSVVVADCAPPPAGRHARGGCASTLAFELADGPHRIIVNCGGDRPWRALPPGLAEGLRTTAAHSTLTLADSNSTAILPDGGLGRGVTLVELDRQEQEQASRIEASHDGYARRFGLTHQRRLALASDGRELAGEDVLLPAGGGARGGATVAFAARFHLAPGVEATPTADGQGAMLRTGGGPIWQFRCRGATLGIEDSIAIDPDGRPAATVQLVASGEAPAGGTSLSWTLRRAG